MQCSTVQNSASQCRRVQCNAAYPVHWYPHPLFALNIASCTSVTVYSVQCTHSMCSVQSAVFQECTVTSAECSYTQHCVACRVHTAHFTVQNKGCSVKCDTRARASVTVHITQEVFCHLTPLVASLIPPASPLILSLFPLIPIREAGLLCITRRIEIFPFINQCFSRRPPR